MCDKRARLLTEKKLYAKPLGAVNNALLAGRFAGSRTVRRYGYSVRHVTPLRRGSIAAAFAPRASVQRAAPQDAWTKRKLAFLLCNSFAPVADLYLLNRAFAFPALRGWRTSHPRTEKQRQDSSRQTDTHDAALMRCADYTAPLWDWGAVMLRVGLQLPLFYWGCQDTKGNPHAAIF